MNKQEVSMIDGPEIPSNQDVIAARNAVDLTQTQAAAIVYVAVRTWQAWEEGTRRPRQADIELFLFKTGQKKMPDPAKTLELVRGIKTRQFVKGVNSDSDSN